MFNMKGKRPPTEKRVIEPPAKKPVATPAVEKPRGQPAEEPVEQHVPAKPPPTSPAPVAAPTPSAPAPVPVPAPAAVVPPVHAAKPAQASPRARLADALRLVDREHGPGGIHVGDALSAEVRALITVVRTITEVSA